MNNFSPGNWREIHPCQSSNRKICSKRIHDWWKSRYAYMCLEYKIIFGKWIYLLRKNLPVSLDKKNIIGKKVPMNFILWLSSVVPKQ